METTDIDVNKIETMTQAELEALEDKVAADEVSDDTADSASPAPSTEQTTQETAKVDGEEAKPTDAGKETDDTPAVKTDEGGEEDLTKHVSPPSKWAQERRERRELQERLDTAEAKAQKADTLEEELTALKKDMDWMRTAIQGKGIELPKDPLETFSDEKINEIREEFGDELAEMFQATRAVLQGNAGSKDTTEQAKPEPAKVDTAASPEVDPAMLKAIDNNDDLSYWKENSPALWSKAIEKDSALLRDPEYLKLSYEERFVKVVEKVKEEVTTASTKTPNAQQDGPPADSLSGSSGAVPSQNGNTPLDRVLAAQNPDDQLKVYNGLSEAERDEVDKALNI